MWLQRVIALGASAVAAPALGDVLYWDPNGITPPNPAGGSGTWSATSGNWWNGSDIQSYDAGVAPHDTIFIPSPDPQAVTISGAVTARSLTFNANGYALSGGTINLADAGIISIADPAHTTTISGSISGVALTRTGAGTLVLSGANSYAGLNVLGGAVSFNSDAHLGSAAGAVAIDGGSLQLTGTSAVATPATRNFIVAPAGATFNITNTSNTGLTIGGALSGTGPLVKSGSGTMRLDLAAHLFAGGIAINGGTFRFNSNNEAGPVALRSNRVTFGASGTTLSLGGSSSSGSELRTGEWHSATGGAGAVIAATTITDTLAGADGHDLMLFALADAMFSGSVNNLATANGGVAGAGSRHGELQVRGIATQTLTGILNVNNTITVTGTGGLRLANNAALTGSGVRLQLKGGSLILNNASANNPDRFNDAGTIDVRGGGAIMLAAHSGGSTETLGQVQLGNATAPRSGQLNIQIAVNPSTSAANVLTLASLQRDTGRATVDFSAFEDNLTHVGTTPLPLGQSGNNARIMFTSPPALNASGLLSDGGAGFATVNGVDFATYGVNGIAPVATTPFNSAGAGDNALLDGSMSMPSTKTIASLKIAPSFGTASLNMLGAADLDTSAVLQAGPFPATISSSGSGGLIGSSARYVFTRADLTISAPISGSGALVKSGSGTLILTAANTYTGPTTINAGNLRIASSASMGSGTLEFRGGVLELAGGGTFNRHLDQGQGAAGTPGLLSWTAVGPGLGQTSETDRGSGGFAAVGSNVIVDINGLGPTDLNWEEPSFLSSGYALLLGSKNANARVEMIDNIGFGLAVSSYNTREIRVIDNPDFTTDIARISGIIYSDTPANGGRLHDLLKSGDGVLELTGNNTYYGGTIIAEGTIIAGHNNALGHATSPYVLLGNRGGAAPASLLANAGINIPQDITIQAGGTGAVTLGGNNTTGVSTFSGKTIILRNVNLAAPAGGTTQLAGGIDNPTGKTLTKTGGGALAISGPQSHGAGAILNVSAGTLDLNSDAGGNLTVNASSVTNFGSNQRLAGLNVGAGVTATVIAGGDKTIRTATPTLASSAKLDLKDNKLIIPAGDVGTWNGTSYTGITGDIRSGRNNGAWNGRGIVTTMPDASAGSSLATLAIATAAQANITTFGGMSVADSDVLVMYTYAGDANLSGGIDGDDYFHIDAGFSSSLSGYFNGDFDYSGKVDADDYFLIDRNYARQGVAVGTVPAGVQAVPEPSALAMMALAAFSLQRRRRRTARCAGGIRVLARIRSDG